MYERKRARNRKITSCESPGGKTESSGNQQHIRKQWIRTAGGQDAERQHLSPLLNANVASPRKRHTCILWLSFWWFSLCIMGVSLCIFPKGNSVWALGKDLNDKIAALLNKVNLWKLISATVEPYNMITLPTSAQESPLCSSVCTKNREAADSLTERRCRKLLRTPGPMDETIIRSGETMGPGSQDEWQDLVCPTRSRFCQEARLPWSPSATHRSIHWRNQSGCGGTMETE